MHATSLKCCVWWGYVPPTFLSCICSQYVVQLSSQVACLLWSRTVYYRITYDNAMTFTLIIISKWLFSSNYHRSYCSADLSLTWKLSVIMASPFLFCYFLPNSLSCSTSISALNVTSLHVLDNYVGYFIVCLSLTQYINDFNLFFLNRVTVNLLVAGFLLSYLLQSKCIPSAYLTLRWPIPSGSVIISSHILSLARTLLIPNIVKILIVFNVTVALVSLLKQLIKLMGLINCIIFMVA